VERGRLVTIRTIGNYEAQLTTGQGTALIAKLGRQAKFDDE